MPDLTRAVKGVQVLRSRLGAPRATGPNCYGPWEPVPEIVALSVHELVGPGYARAKFAIDLARAGPQQKPMHAWHWRSIILSDDRLAIVTAADESTSPACYFSGFVVEPEMGWSGGQDEHVTLTAVGAAYRLVRDVLVYGRFMTDANDDMYLFTGFPCVFNAGGRPNMAADRQTGLGYGPAEGVPYFTFDGDPNGEYWSLGDILDYLKWRYNAEETWIANGAADPLAYFADPALIVACEGVPLWNALAAACDLGHADIAERPKIESGEPVTPTPFAVVSRGAGDVVEVKRQDVNPDGTFQVLDLAETNLFTSTVTESVAACVTRPIVAGGIEQYEVTVELGQAWDPARLAAGSGEVPDPDGNEPGEQLFDRYDARGEDFWQYSDVGRLWDANADGRYSATPYNLAEADMAQLAGEGAGTWPRVPYLAHKCLTAIAELSDAPSQEAVLQVSLDNGQTWCMITGWHCLPDRLGIYIDVHNLATIPDPDLSQEKNLLEQLLDTPSYVLARLTCTVDAPRRAIYQPDPSGAGGTAFDAVAWFSRGELGQKRTVAESSALMHLGLGSDYSEGGEELQALGDALRNALEDRRIEASLAIEWPDEGIQLTDVIEKIGGIDYPLALKVGDGPPRYPRVVGRDLFFTPETWAMKLYLGTDRHCDARFGFSVGG